MPTFLSDPPRGLLLTLAIAFAIAAGVWFSGRSRRALLGVFITGGLLGLVLLIDALVESPREQAVSAMRRLANATQSRDEAAVTRAFAENFRHGNTTRKTIAEKFRRIGQVWPEWRGGTVWGFDRGSYQQLSETQLKVGFTGQAVGYPQTQHYIVATFSLEGDAWKISKVQFYDPFKKDLGGEVQIPEFGN